MKRGSTSVPNGQPLLTLAGVSFGYDSQTPVVHDISFTVSAGERIALMGANGSGKSTVVRLACGLLSPISGDVWASGLAYVAQDPQANVVGESVAEDVGFAAHVRGESPERVAVRVRGALEAVGMEWALHRPMSALSGGEIQRVALAGALAGGATLWVLDEPTGHLPKDEARAFWQSVNSLASDAGVGVLYVTHQPQEARIADRVLCLANGRVALAGRPQHVLRRLELLQHLGIRCDTALALLDCLDPERLPQSSSEMEGLDERAVESLCSALKL